MDFTQESATRGAVGPVLFQVGTPGRVFDRTITNGLGTLVVGEVMSLYESTGNWRKYNAADTTFGILCEPISTGYSGTPILPVFQRGAVKLSALTGAPGGWKVGMVISGLILC